MKNVSWFSRLLKQQPSFAMYLGMLVAMFLALACIAVAQNPASPVPPPGAPVSAPNGYTIHQSIDVGGHMNQIDGAGAMYDTMVNSHTGPRVFAETFEMHAQPSNKNPLVDDLKAVSNGFGGDSNNFAKLDFSKAKWYEFSGMFRRDRRYFDYDLLGNPGIPYGYSIPISGSTTPYAWPQIGDSPFMFNTVRRMTDTSLTLLPLSKVTFRFAYSKNIFQGPSLTPSGNSVGGSEILLEEFQRSSTDDFTAALDWKPFQGTKLTYEEQIDHYKGDSYFNVDPALFTVQESDGTKVALLANYQNYYPYGYSSTTGAFSPSGSGQPCNGSSMISASTILYANPAGGLPIIDPACNVISSYLRSQPTREIFPTEIFRLQSSSIKNVSMNGNIRFTKANMNLPNYYEIFQGLDGASRELAETGYANAQRQVLAFDYGIVWQATKTVSLSDEISYSHAQQPGTAGFTGGTKVTVPTTAGEETINYTGLTSTPVTSGAPPDGPSEGSPSIGAPQFNFFAQKFVTNNATVSWDATARTTLSLTYRYRVHDIVEGSPNTTSSQTGESLFSIDEQGGIFNAAVRPTSNWDLNGTVEILYDNNVFTPVGPRQTKHYRVHTLYRPKAWATISGAYNDLERHDNTNNQPAGYWNTSSGGPMLAAPTLDHVDHSRVVSLAADLMPNEHYGFDLNYAYSDVYSATNGCFEAAAQPMPGGGNVPGIALQNGNLCTAVATSTHGLSTVLVGPTKDFEDAPTQYASAALTLVPNPKFHSDLGYRLSDVNGSRFFTDAMDVNGDLVSKYQTPFVSAAWTVHPGVVWKAEYNYFGYGEGGRSGSQYCMNNPALAAGVTNESGSVVACSTVPNTAMNSATPVYGFTNPRNFHANNVMLGLHWEF